MIVEVEEIAAPRGGEPPSAMQGVTNELVTIIPPFRDSPDHRLICATISRPRPHLGVGYAATAFGGAFTNSSMMPPASSTRVMPRMP